MCRNAGGDILRVFRGGSRPLNPCIHEQAHHPPPPGFRRRYTYGVHPARNKIHLNWVEQSMVGLSIKEEARRIIDALPDNSSWSDLMYEIYVHREIELGLADLDAGRTKSHDEVKQILANRR